MAKLYFRYGAMGSSKSANALMVAAAAVKHHALTTIIRAPTQVHAVTMAALTKSVAGKNPITHHSNLLATKPQMIKKW